MVLSEGWSIKIRVLGCDLIKKRGYWIGWKRRGREYRGRRGRGWKEPCHRVTDKCWEETTQRVRHVSWQLGLTWSQKPGSCHSDLDSICRWRNPPSPVTWGCLPAQNTARRLCCLPGQPPGTLRKDSCFVFLEKNPTNLTMRRAAAY